MERTRRGKQRKARDGKIVASSAGAAFVFEYNSTKDGCVVNSEQMRVVRRIFRMAAVEKTTIYAIRQYRKKAGIKTPSGKTVWDLSFVRGLLMNDIYEPHTFAEMQQIVSPAVAFRLDPNEQYGVWWYGRRTCERKRVSKNDAEGRQYRYNYRVNVRPMEEQVGVPAPDSRIPPKWVDAAREALRDNRRPANAGR